MDQFQLKKTKTGNTDLLAVYGKTDNHLATDVLVDFKQETR